MADTSIVVKLIDETRAGFQSINSNIEGLDRNSKALKSSFDGLKTAAAAFVGVIAGRATIDFIDTIQTMDNRLKLVTKSQGELNTTFNELFDVAQRTRSPLAETVDLFSKLSQNQAVSKQSTEDLAKVTEAFTSTLSISGTSGNAAAGAITQFGQAMASGKLAGDEFRTMAEANPKLLAIISEQTGIARENLKELASKGFLTAEIAAIALKNALPELQAEMAKTDVTVRQAITQMTNEFQKLGREFLDSSGTSKFLVEAIQLVTKNMDDLIPILKLIGLGLVAVAAYFAPLTLAFGVASAAVVYFADKLGPVAQEILDAFGRALELVVPKLAGVGAALVALVNLENPFTAYTKASDESAASFVKTTAANKDLNTASQALTNSKKTLTGQTDEMKDAMARSGLATAGTKSKYDEYITTLKMANEVADQDKTAKEVQIAVTKALEAATEDAHKKGQVISENLKYRITQEVTTLVEATAQKKEQYEKTVADQKKSLDDAVDLLKKYSAEYKKNNEDVLTATDLYTKRTQEIEAAHNEAQKQASKLSADERTTISKNYQDALRFAQTSALDDLHKEYTKYIENNKTEEQKFRDKLKEIDEAHNLAILGTAKLSAYERAQIEQKHQDIMFAIQGQSLDKLYKEHLKDLDNKKTTTDTYTKDIEKIELAYRTAMENSAKFSTEQIAEIEKKHQELLIGRQTQGLEKLAKEYSKHLDDTKSNTEKFTEASTEIDREYRRAMESSASMSTEQIAEIEKNHKDALLGAQNKFSQDIRKIAEEQRKSEMTATEKYAESIQKLNEAQNAGLITNQETYDLARRKIEKDYRDATATEYSNLYGALTDKIKEFTGLNNKEFGLLKDTVKLVFGVDIDTIIKQAFAEFVKYIIGFRQAGDSEIGMFTGIFSKIFGKSGSGAKEVGDFASEGTSLLKGFGTSGEGIFSSIGSIISSVFSGGLSVIGKFASSAFDILKGLGKGAGSIFDSIGGFIGDVFSGGGGGILDTVIDGVGSLLDFGSSAGSVLGSIGEGLGVVGSALGTIGLAAAGIGIITGIGDALGLDKLFGVGAYGSAAQAEKAHSAIASREANDRALYTEGSQQNKALKFQASKDRVAGGMGFAYDYFALGLPLPDPSFRAQSAKSITSALKNIYGVDVAESQVPKTYHYAMGGIINRQTMFPMQDGNIGVAGEAGTEAILPLSRGSNGELGVQGGGAVNISFTINAIDSRGIDQLLVEKRQFITNMVRSATAERGRKVF